MFSTFFEPHLIFLACSKVLKSRRQGLLDRLLKCVKYDYQVYNFPRTS